MTATKLPWILAFAALTLVLLATGLWALRRSRQPLPLPTVWALTPRPVFSTDERRFYRLLREALPHHVILAKLPLVRFCQPAEVTGVRYWFDLLGAAHVAFAVCSANGRVLAAIDIDAHRISAGRTLQIKHSVMAACRIRYLRCSIDKLPTLAELQLLVPQNGAGPRAPQAGPGAHSIHEASESLAHTVASRRAQRTALWQDSTFFQDSFFALDSRFDGADFGNHSGPGKLGGRDDIAGVVVDDNAPPAARSS